VRLRTCRVIGGILRLEFPAKLSGPAVGRALTASHREAAPVWGRFLFIKVDYSAAGLVSTKVFSTTTGILATDIKERAT